MHESRGQLACRPSNRTVLRQHHVRSIAGRAGHPGHGSAGTLEFYLVHTGVGTDPYWKGVADGFVDFCQQAGMVGVVKALGASGKSEKERIEDQFEEIQKLIQEQREGPMGLISAQPISASSNTQGQDAPSHRGGDEQGIRKAL